MRTRRFLLLVIGITALTFSAYADTLNLIPLFAEHGYTAEFAAIGFALVGIGQVIGRIGLIALNRYIAPRFRPGTVGAAVAVVLAMFALIPGPELLLGIVAAVAGAARGALTLVQATAVAERWGTTRLGSLNGLFRAPITAATALAPVAGVGVETIADSYAIAAAVFAVVAFIGAVLVLAADVKAPSSTVESQEGL